MKSLVTGGAGFIGSHIVDKLLELGHEVICYDNESAESNEEFYWNSKADNIKGDIRDYHLLKDAMRGVDYVFHLAAESRIGPSIDNPLDTVQKNCLGTATVLQCARKWGVKKVMYSSTSSGYGNNPHPNVETQPDDCLNPYSVTKIAGEKLCKMYTDLFGMKTVTFRYFNVYGDRAPRTGQYSPVIGIFFRQRDAGEDLTIVGDGEQRRDFVHVSDVVSANLAAAFNDVDDVHYGQVYNVGSGKNYSVNEIASWISDKQVHLPERVGEVRVSLANIDKIKSVFGWEPKVDLEEWVRSR